MKLKKRKQFEETYHKKKLHWPKDSLDQTLLGQMSLGYLSPCIKVSLDSCSLDNCINTHYCAYSNVHTAINTLGHPSR